MGQRNCVINAINIKKFTTETTEIAEIIEELNKITKTIIGAAIAVHKELGPGLLESAYEACLAYELTERGLIV